MIFFTYNFKVSVAYFRLISIWDLNFNIGEISKISMLSKLIYHVWHLVCPFLALAYNASSLLLSIRGPMSFGAN